LLLWARTGKEKEVGRVVQDKRHNRPEQDGSSSVSRDHIEKKKKQKTIERRRVLDH
jgi:hypothetical protein